MHGQITFILITFAAAFLGFFLLTQSHRKILSFFYVPAGKSASNARLLAGLPLSLSVIISLSYVAFQGPYTFLILSWVLCSLSIVAYGFWDDKFEIKAKTKLQAQLLAAITFAFLASTGSLGTNPLLSFGLVSFCALSLMNGTNLLDGLDTMTIKLSSVVFITFSIIGIIFNATELFVPALLFLAPLWAFYFFNKEPSRLHLGEIGGSFLGFGSLLLGTICFAELRGKLGEIKALFLAILPFVWPVTELASSFIRRLYIGKSPFQGDRLHIHHILRTDFSLSSNQVTNILGISCLIISLLGLMTSVVSHPIIGFLVMAISQGSLYIMVCKHRWLVRKKEAPYWNVLTSSLKRKEPCYIAVTYVDHLQIAPKKKKGNHLIQA